MPLEGHWQRQQTPLRRLTGRERRVLRATAGVLLAATVTVLVVAILRTAAPAHAGCIEVTGPSTTGAAVYRACGADAARLCREQTRGSDPTARAIQARCRVLGLSRRPGRP